MTWLVVERANEIEMHTHEKKTSFKARVIVRDDWRERCMESWTMDREQRENYSHLIIHRVHSEVLI